MSKEKCDALRSPPLRPPNAPFPQLSSAPLSTRTGSSGGGDEPVVFWRSSLSWSPSAFFGNLPGSLPCSPEERAPLSPLNVTTSSGPICRICHEGDQKWPLLSPCTCAGTMGLVHLVCLEHWLSASGGDQCEICHYRFSTQRRQRGFCEWLQGSHRNVRRSVIGDFFCFAMLTPLACLCGILCLQGAVHQVLDSRLWAAVGLTTLAVMLLLVYAGWSLLMLRFHRKTWKKWQKANPDVRVLGMAGIPIVVSAPESLREDVDCRAAPVAPTTVSPGALGETSVIADVHQELESVSVQSAQLCFSPATVTFESTEWEYCTSRL
ncbi:E3 ubiquitin-protein ligase MARCHF3-like [Ixodes scapularis]|uniref:E3 ubiquitin-protein ligase MARCHF3-like n=1 Tax=Ixodes scapularis TaxID=6945 RepID=UPI001A9EB429|nr:E3 ubiquitin-protein ligase MARCHF3-like [Ixodes scapularis]